MYRYRTLHYPQYLAKKGTVHDIEIVIRQV